jgi:DNA-binding CsgD family transcriptional regulator
LDAETQLCPGTLGGGLRKAHARDIERLVVALIERAGGTEALLGGPGIILDLTVRGVRYVLIRCDEPPAVADLSPREREIARMVANGLANKSIANVLEISPWTVSTHLRRIFTKLSVTTRAAMVARLVIWNPAILEQARDDGFRTIQDLCCDQNRESFNAS